MDGIGSYFPATEQKSNTFPTDLSWDDWLSLGLVAEPDFTLPQNCPLPHNSASRCPSLDSNASSDQSITQDWPINFQENPHLNFPSCLQIPAQPDIESCIPHLSHSSPPEPLASPSPTPPNPSPPRPPTKKPLSPLKRKHGPRNKPDPPAKEPVAKKETKPKTATSNRTAHSIIEHNYRKNLNTKMEQLRQILSTADSAKPTNSSEVDNDDSDNSTENNKDSSTTPITRKSDVLIHAYSYVQRSEREKKSMKDENEFLRGRVVKLEKMVRCEDCSLLKEMGRLRMGAGAGGGMRGRGMVG